MKPKDTLRLLARVDALEQSIDQIGQKLASIEQRLAQIEAQLAEDVTAVSVVVAP